MYFVISNLCCGKLYYLLSQEFWCMLSCKTLSSMKSRTMPQTLVEFLGITILPCHSCYGTLLWILLFYHFVQMLFSFLTCDIHYKCWSSIVDCYYTSLLWYTSMNPLVLSFCSNVTFSFYLWCSISSISVALILLYICLNWLWLSLYAYIYIYMCVCVCMYTYIYMSLNCK